MSIRVLIADDHEIVRLGLRSSLEESPDIEIVGEAFDGVTAISKSIDCVPDVVLMDIRMPIVDGIEATREIKMQLKNTRVLILTSNDNQEFMFAALAAGADGYCLKDAQGKRLRQAIQAVHSGASWLDPQIASIVLRAAVPAVALPSVEDSALVKVLPFGLSLREIDILRLVVEGLSNSEMADRLEISIETVKTHMKHVLEKLKVTDRTQAAVKAMREGLV